MKNLKVVFAVVAMSMALFSCKKTAQEQTQDAQDSLAQAEQELQDAQQNLQEALNMETLLGAWTATTPNADGGVATLKVTFKENNKYDFSNETEGAKADVKTDLDFTLEGNVITLADGSKLEYADGVLYRLDADGKRLNAEGQETDIFKKLM